MTKFEIGAGYRRLQPGETIATGDGVWISGRWDSTADAGRKVRLSDMPYRRRVAEYRLLQPGEVIVAGDEYRLKHKAEDRTWIRTADAGRLLSAGEDLEYRRLETPPAIEPGEGYRLLVVGERIVEVDEIYYDDPVHWRDAMIVGDKVCNAVFRRKVTAAQVDPGAGYRLLAVGERIAQGDEIFGVWKVNSWSQTALVGEPVRDAVFRRKVTAAQVDPGAGYRPLAVGEMIATGDEYFDSTGWHPFVYAVGTEMRDFHTISRRRFQPPRAVIEKKYRLLNVGEIISPGDEMYHRSEWEPCLLLGVLTLYDLPVRRAMELGYIGGPA